ncbi:MULTISPECIES: hypothetical protein [Inquilinus]|uniref:Uncharacterized protein n=1 Tax=Inquilinus ginsengisoli TaxID=363840 RepID=A0ABU1JJA2_9PROT|nr:hypothetical protein [Inquilinus ginsengisoli]MDR6288696.1 hypothetical protein [Inquilinus ginsengisoli]
MAALRVSDGRSRAIGLVRPVLAIEALAFTLASLVHRGWIMAGYAHGAAATAETVIAAALLTGLALSMIRPARAQVVGLAVQAFALLGTLVGLFAVLRGFGPQTQADLVYHGVMVAALVAGLAAVARAGRPAAA